MIEPGYPGLTIGKQCRLLSNALPSFDDQPKGGAASNFGLMRQIDERPADVETPFLCICQHLGTFALRIHCRTMDNIFAEHPWRSQVCECVCPFAWKTGSEVKVGIARWIGFYNYKRPHSALGGNPPAECIG